MASATVSAMTWICSGWAIKGGANCSVSPPQRTYTPCSQQRMPTSKDEPLGRRRGGQL
ncbi:MAG: hypothetical protein CM15mP120_00170 [Pseudomonadota bacterium]|nr:MAG: hypothetical protein CM15mP120_00170 [Pseudomonadota bacterium]